MVIYLNPDKKRFFSKLVLISQWFLLAVSLTYLSGCTTMHLRLPEKAQPCQIKKIKDWLPTPYVYEPGGVRLIQRIILSFPRRELDMTGYLILEQNGNWLALALADMGVELFRFKKSNGSLRVVTAPQGISKRPLLEGVAGDIDYLFGRKNAIQTFSSYSEEISLRKWIQYGESHFDEYIFEPKKNHPVKSREFIEDQIIRSVRYEDYRLDSLKKKIVPHLIVLKNHLWHYEMEIKLYKVEQLTE